jgi:hypothetical protein
VPESQENEEEEEEERERIIKKRRRKRVKGMKCYEDLPQTHWRLISQWVV